MFYEVDEKQILLFRNVLERTDYDNDKKELEEEKS